MASASSPSGFTPEQPNQAAFSRCSYCGTRALDGSSPYCPYCGKPRASGPAGGDSTRRSPSRSRAKIVAGLILLFLFLLIVPVPHPVSNSFETYVFSLQSAPLGSANTVWLTGSWSTNGGTAAVTILNSEGKSVYNGTGSSGSFSVGLPGSPPYSIAAYSIAPVEVTVSGWAWSTVVPDGLP